MEIDVKLPQQSSSQDNPRADDQRTSAISQAWIPTKNPASLVSYYAGVFGLLPFIGLPATVVAIVAGIVALNKYRQKPTPGAKVHAIIGLILGCLQVVIFISYVFIMISSSKY